MKKTFSVFLSFVMLFTCLCVGGISAQAAEKKTKITYLYEPETQTLYIRGKGAVPAYYLGWDECKNDDYNDKFSERDEYYGIVKESTSDGSYTIVDSSEIDYEILIRNIYPSFYIDTTRYVKKIVFEEGITSIGDGAFSYAFPKLEQVYFLPPLLPLVVGCFHALAATALIVLSCLPRLKKWIDTHFVK